MCKNDFSMFDIGENADLLLKCTTYQKNSSSPDANRCQKKSQSLTATITLCNLIFSGHFEG